MFTTKIKFLAISIFLTGIILAVASYGIEYTKNQTSEIVQNRDVKVFYRQTSQSSKDTAPVLDTTRYRLRKADGSWKETTTVYAPDGSIMGKYDTYAINGEGIFAVSEKTKTLSFRAERPAVIPQFSEANFKSQPDFAGESEIAGFRVLVQKSSNGDSVIGEFYISPELNGLELKFVNKIGDNIFVDEATEVKVEPISEQEFGNLPDYPIDYSSFENYIRAVESVNKEQADQMKKRLPKKK